MCLITWNWLVLLMLWPVFITPSLIWFSPLFMPLLHFLKIRNIQKHMHINISTLIQILEHSLKYLYEILHFIYNIKQGMSYLLSIGLIGSSCIQHKFSRHLKQMFWKHFSHGLKRKFRLDKNYIKFETLICLIIYPHYENVCSEALYFFSIDLKPATIFFPYFSLLKV